MAEIHVLTEPIFERQASRQPTSCNRTCRCFQSCQLENFSECDFSYFPSSFCFHINELHALSQYGLRDLNNDMSIGCSLCVVWLTRHTMWILFLRRITEPANYYGKHCHL